MRARLVPADGGAVIELQKDLTVVGRGDDCDVRLDHKSVSKRHCVLVKTDGLVLVRDLGSTNGSRVNGQRVRRAALLPNDQFAVANYKFIVVFGDGKLDGDGAAPEPETKYQLEPEGPDSDHKLPAAPPAADVVQRNTLPDEYEK